MTVPSVSKIGLPGPQLLSRTGGWLVSSCHGESGARAGVALRILVSFFGGRGFSLGKACAPVDCGAALDGRAAKKPIATAAKISATAVALRRCERERF